ncbi:MAG: YciI family protein [Planctomycetota bacterium]
MEAKEFVASSSLIQADDLDAAVAIAAECPGHNVIEIRELAGYA